MKHDFFHLAALATFLLMMTALGAQAQDVWPCGHAEAQDAFDAAYPGAREARDGEEARLRSAAQDLLSRGGQDNELYVIPVVFHVIHDNGPENISAEQIHDAMDILNRDFRKLNSDTAQIVAGFVDVAADIDVEFRLAKRDPQGNCHSGINRVENELTYVGNSEMKQLVNWPRRAT